MPHGQRGEGCGRGAPAFQMRTPEGNARSAAAAAPTADQRRRGSGGASAKAAAAAGGGGRRVWSRVRASRSDVVGAMAGAHILPRGDEIKIGMDCEAEARADDRIGDGQLSQRVRAHAEGPTQTLQPAHPTSTLVPSHPTSALLPSPPTSTLIPLPPTSTLMLRRPRTKVCPSAGRTACLSTPHAPTHLR